MNSLVRMPQQQDGNWMWDGSQWICSPPNPTPPPGCATGQPPFCPPPGFPPHGCPPWFSGANSPPWYPGANAGVSFGTSPPMNPVRGHFWWDGQTLWIFDGAAWSAAGGGAGGQGAASVAIGTTPPVAPQPGALWFDGAMLLLWNGNAWVPTEGNASGATPPANPSNGMLWWNGSNLMVWDGNAWVAVSATKSYIQSTAPPSPNAGDTWWDGTQMRIWTGSAWALVGPGATVGPVATTTQTFAMQQPAALSASPLTAWVVIPYSATPLIDTQSAWDSVQHRLTPKVAGMYAFGLRGLGSAGGGLAIAKNDPGTYSGLASDITVTITSFGVGAAGWMQCEGFAPMNGTTDFVRAWGWVASGNFPAAGSNPVFSAVLFP